MATEKRGHTVGTYMEARQNELEPSTLLLLTIIIGLASLIVCVAWLIFVH